MNIDSFILKTAFFVVPGYIGFSICQKLKSSSHLENSHPQWRLVFNVFVFTLVSYILYDLINSIISNFTHSSPVSLFEVFTIQSKYLSVSEMINLILISIAIGIIHATFENYHIVTKIFNWLKVTNVSTGEDVWSYCVKDRRFEWIIFRDFKNGLSFLGHIDKYSLSDNTREILLTDVDVYSSSDSKYLYHCDCIYLSRENHEFSIEVNAMIIEKERNNVRQGRKKHSGSSK